MPCILAIDQSTSATKALLFDTDGALLDSEVRTHRQFHPQPGWVEHDGEEIWRNVLAVSSELLGRQTAHIDDLAGVSISNQRETVIIFEKGTGVPLAPAIVWQCRRGDALCAELTKSGRGELVESKTGLRIDAYFSGSKLQWLMRERPEFRLRLTYGTALIGTIDTYLIYRLTDGKVFATDPTNASRTLLFDIDALNWNDPLCACWEVPRTALAEVRASADRFGETTLGGVLPRPVPICGVMGDSQASLFAHRCFEPGSAKVTFGSGSSVLMNIGRKRPAPGAGAVTALAWVINDEPTYALEGLITYSGATLTWLRDQLGLIQNLEETEALAFAAGAGHGVYLVPAFSGLAAPYWCESARATLVGLTAHSDRRHVVRAALESIAYQLRGVLEMMESHSGIKLESLNCDGGATDNRFLMQFAADITGVVLRVGRGTHLSALGAAKMGMLGLGLRRSLRSLGELPTEEGVYRPAMPPDEVHACWTGWQRAVLQVIHAAVGSKLPPVPQQT
jgi:glycerol kinase